MNWRRLLGMGIATTFCVLLLYWLMPRYDIDPETAELITPRMSEQDVIKLLKAPPGWYAGRNRDYLRGPTFSREIFTSAGVLMRDGSVLKAWGGHSLMVVVSFDGQGRVISCYTTHVFDGLGSSWGESIFQKMRRWCRLN